MTNKPHLRHRRITAATPCLSNKGALEEICDLLVTVPRSMRTDFPGGAGVKTPMQRPTFNT